MKGIRNFVGSHEESSAIIGIALSRIAMYIHVGSRVNHVSKKALLHEGDNTVSLVPCCKAPYFYVIFNYHHMYVCIFLLLPYEALTR